MNFYPRDAMHERGICSRKWPCLSVCHLSGFSNQYWSTAAWHNH